MRRILARAAIFSAAVMLVCAPAALAISLKAPVVVGDMDVQMWPEAEKGQTVVIASVSIDETATLPVRVRIPVVKGMQVQWVGEIGGAEASQDPTRSYTIDEGIGGDYVEMTVTKNRIAQVEMIGLPVTTTGEVTKAALPWVQTAPASITAFSVRTIAGARDVKITPAPVGTVNTNESGESLYTLPSKELKPGGSAKLSVSYKTGTEFEGGLDDGTSGSRTVIWVLLGGIAIAVVFLVLAVRRQGSAG